MLPAIRGYLRPVSTPTVSIDPGEHTHVTDHREPDDGSDIGTDELTSGGAGTVRDELDHAGEPRTSGHTDDAGATTAAARELDDENEDEPTRSE